MPTWAQFVYLLCAICFILALKGLSGPKTARNGNLIGAAGAVVACALPFFYVDDMENVALILVAIAIGTAGGAIGAQKVQMTQMPQMVALFNGVGGGAAALVALLELEHFVDNDIRAVYLIATAFTILVGSVSFAGSIITFAKLQELMTSRPVIFPGLPVVFGGALVAALVLSGVTVAEPVMWAGIVLGLVGLAVGVLLVLPVGGADVPIVISLLNAFTGLTVAAGGYVLQNTVLLVAGTLVGRQRYLPHPADGPGDGSLGGQHPVRRPEGRLDPRRRRGLGPPGSLGHRRGCRDHAQLRRSGDHRARLRARGRPGAALAARAGRRAQRAWR